MVIGGETSAERMDESSPTPAFPEPEQNSVLTPHSHTTSHQNTVSVTPVEVPDEGVQEDVLAVVSQVEMSANQCLQIGTPYYPVDPLESFLNEVIKDQSEFCEPDGLLSGLSDSEDNIEVADLSQSSSDHSEVSPQRIVSFQMRLRKVNIQKYFPDLPAFKRQDL